MKAKSISLLFLITCLTSTYSIANDVEIPIITGEWPPYTSEKMEGFGLQSELISAVFEEMGEVPSFQFLPWIRGQDDLSQGKAFASFPYKKTQQRSIYFDFSDVIYLTDTVFFYFKGNMKKISYQSLDDLKNHSIGGVLGYSYTELFSKSNFEKIYLVHLDKQLITMLGNKHIDLVAMDKVNGWLEIKKQYPNKLNQFCTLDKPLFASSDSRLMISRKYPNHESLRIRFNIALEKIKKNGRYDLIVNKYLFTSSTIKP